MQFLAKLFKFKRVISLILATSLTVTTLTPASAGVLGILRAMARDARAAATLARMSRLGRLAEAAGLAAGLSFELTSDFAQAIPMIAHDDEGWVVTSNFRSQATSKPGIFETDKSAADPIDAWINVKYQDDNSVINKLSEEQKKRDLQDYMDHSVLIVDQSAFSPTMSDDLIESYALAHKVLVHCEDGKLRQLHQYRGAVSGKTRLILYYDALNANVAAPVYDATMPAAFASLRQLPSRYKNINVISFYDSPATRAELSGFKQGVMFDVSGKDPAATLRNQLKPFQNQVVFALFHNENGVISLNTSLSSAATQHLMSLKQLEDLAHSCCNVTIFPLTCKASSYSRLIGFNEDLDAPLMLHRLKEASSAATQAELLSKLASKDAILVVDPSDFAKQGRAVANILVYDKHRKGLIIIGSVAVGGTTAYYLYSS